MKGTKSGESEFCNSLITQSSLWKYYQQKFSQKEHKENKKGDNQHKLSSKDLVSATFVGHGRNQCGNVYAHGETCDNPDCPTNQ